MRFSNYKTAAGTIHWNYSVNDQGQVLHLVKLPNGKGILKTNTDLIAIGLLARFDPRTVKAYNNNILERKV